MTGCLSPPPTPLSSSLLGVERRSVRVKVPGTSANLGPGFDCMGIAVDVWNDLTVERSDEFSMIIEGEGSDELPRDETNLVVIGMKVAFKVAGKPMPVLKYICNNHIPFARGLGSSSAAVVSGIVAGLTLSGCELPVVDSEALFNLACQIEGHPDNVAAAIYGGLQIGICLEDKEAEKEGEEKVEESKSNVGEEKEVRNEKRWYSSRVKLPAGLQCVVYLPNWTLLTSESRNVLPKSVPLIDATFNVSRAALFINALTNGNLSELEYAMQDALHQPYRERLNPHLLPLIHAAKKAGAHGVCLSGAGSAIMAITSGAKGDIYSQRRAERVEENVSQKMLEAAEKIGMKGRVVITQPTEKGAHVVSVDPPFSGKNILHFTHSNGGEPI